MLPILLIKVLFKVIGLCRPKYAYVGLILQYETDCKIVSLIFPSLQQST